MLQEHSQHQNKNRTKTTPKANVEAIKAQQAQQLAYDPAGINHQFKQGLFTMPYQRDFVSEESAPDNSCEKYAPKLSENNQAPVKAEANDSKRLTNLKHPTLANKEDELINELENEKGDPKTQMLTNAQPALDKNHQHIEQIKKTHQKTTSSIATNLRAGQNSAKKEVIGKGGETLQKPDRKGVSVAQEKVINALPKDSESFKERQPLDDDDKINVPLDDLKSVLVNKATTIKQQYGEGVAQAPASQPTSQESLNTKKPSKELSKKEPLPIDELKTGQMVDESHFDSIREAEVVATDMLRREGIGDGQGILYEEFQEARSSASLGESIRSYETIQDSATNGIEEIRSDEKAHHQVMECSIRKAEDHYHAHAEEARAAYQRDSQNISKEKYKEYITQKMGEAYSNVQGRVQGKLAALEQRVSDDFDEVKTNALSDFEKNVQEELEAPTLPFLGTNISSKIRSEKLTFEIKILRGIYYIIKDINKTVDECKDDIVAAQRQLQDIVGQQTQDPAFQKIAKEAEQEIEAKLDALNQEIDDKANSLKEALITAHRQAVTEVDKKIEKIKTDLKNRLGFFGRLLVDAAYKFFKWALSEMGVSAEEIQEIMKAINKSIDVLTLIVTDPIGFFKHLGEAVGAGFNNFASNILHNLGEGLFKWLTGTLGGAGITLPKTWDLQGIFSLVLQVLGLTWNSIRAKIAREIGEENMDMLEHVVEDGIQLFKDIREHGFVTAIWNFIQKKATEIKDAIIKEIEEWVVTKVVQVAVEKVISMLNPAGWVVQAVMAIYRFIRWLIDNLKRIAKIFNSIVDSISNIAHGHITEAAHLIEKTLVDFIPTMLDLFARMIGLGNVSKRIQHILEKIRKPIDTVIDKAIAWVKKRLGPGNHRQSEEEEGSSGVEVTEQDRKNHRNYFNEIKKQLQAPIQPHPANFRMFYGRKTGLAYRLQSKYQKKLKPGIKIRITSGTYEQEKKDLDIDFRVRIFENTLTGDVTVPYPQTSSIVTVGDDFTFAGKEANKTYDFPKTSEAEAWVALLGKDQRAEERALADDIIRKAGGNKRGNPLNIKKSNAYKSLTGYLEPRASSGVGAPGFTIENVKVADKVSPRDTIEHIHDTILGGEGKNTRTKMKSADSKEQGKDEAAKMIRRVNYPGMPADEMHAIGLGNDVLAASYRGDKRSAAAYKDIVPEFDKAFPSQTQRAEATRWIASYAGLKLRGVDPIDLDNTPSPPNGALLREFATIQLAEKGRELRRAKDANNGAGVRDQNIVEAALSHAAQHGFRKVYVQEPQKYAVFAKQGGQAALREVYNPRKRTSGDPQDTPGTSGTQNPDGSPPKAPKTGNNGR